MREMPAIPMMQHRYPALIIAIAAPLACGGYSTSVNNLEPYAYESSTIAVPVFRDGQRAFFRIGELSP